MLNAVPAPVRPKVAGPKVTEEEILKVLSQNPRTRTIDLVHHFEDALKDSEQKQVFTNITRRLCSIVEDGTLKYLVLK
jgi:hypothetical protein